MNQKTLFELLLRVPDGLILICALIGLLRFKSLGTVQRLLFWLICIVVVTEVISQLLWQQGANNFPVFHIYAVLEFSILTLIYRNTFKQKKLRRLLTIIMVLFIAFGSVNALFFQSILEPNTNVTSTSSLLLIGFAAWFFFRVLNDMRYDRLDRSAMFWINIGVLIYFCSSFVLFNFGEQLVSVSIENTINIWTLHIFFNVIHYIAFCIALWMKPE